MKIRPQVDGPQHPFNGADRDVSWQSGHINGRARRVRLPRAWWDPLRARDKWVEPVRASFLPLGQLAFSTSQPGIKIMIN